MLSLLIAATLAFQAHSSPQSPATPPTVSRTLGAGPLPTRDGFLYVPVRVGGQPAQWFMLDTGSYRSYVTAKGCERLLKGGVVPRKDGQFGPLEAKVVGVPLGKTPFALDTTGFPHSPDPDSDGILGMDLLRNCRIGLDIGKGQFRVWPASEPVSRVVREWFPPVRGSRKAAAKPISAYLWHRGLGTYSVTVQVANLSLPMCVDTGSEETYLGRELAPALRPGVKVGKGKAAFYFGVADVEYYRVAGYGLEGASIRAPRPIGATDTTTDPGILGSDVLSQGRALLDFPGKRLYLLPAKAGPRAAASLKGPSVDLPNGVSIQYPLGEVVRVEPGCEYEVSKSYRKMRRPDGTLDLVPPGMKVPPFRVKPRLFLAPTIDGKPCWSDRPVNVPPKAKHTVPPGWTKVRREDGSLDLFPPGWREKVWDDPSQG